jgi:hypothetical protein
MKLWEDLSTANFLLESHHVVQKEIGVDSSTGLFPKVTLKELVFMCHAYYSIFLLKQEASTL